MFFSLACGGETPSGPSRAYAPGFQMRKDKSPNPSRTRLSRILAQPSPSPPAAEATPRCPPAPRGRAPEDVCSTASPPPRFFLLNPFFFY